MPPVWQVAGLVDGAGVPDVDGVGLLVSSRDLAAAERTMACGQLADYLDGIHEPLTPGRFLRNVVDSVANRGCACRPTRRSPRTRVRPGGLTDSPRDRVPCQALTREG